jgi:hypothetical protein
VTCRYGWTTLRNVTTRDLHRAFEVEVTNAQEAAEMARMVVLRFEVDDDSDADELVEIAEGIGSGDFGVPSDWTFRDGEVEDYL